MIKKFISSVLVLALVVVTSGILNPIQANAASITTARATFGRLKASTPSDSVVVTFASPTGIQTGGADTITLTFSADFTVAAAAAANFDIGLGNSGTCSSATYTDETVALTPSATQWGVGVAGNVITLSPDTDVTLTAGYCIRVEMGTAAVTGGTGSASTITNGALDDDDTITIGGAFGDNGVMTVDIIDDDQVSVTATVNQTLTFDLDTATSDIENGPNYSVPLGVLAAGTVTVSNGSINMIIAEGGTNASGGMNVTVRNTNGANGLVSTSVSADKIPSATATMAAGTPNYGLCVGTAALTGFTRATGYVSDTCALGSATNQVRALSTTPTDIITSTAPVATGHAEIVVNAAISAATPAHTDYTDTLTFVASASF